MVSEKTPLISGGKSPEKSSEEHNISELSSKKYVVFVGGLFILIGAFVTFSGSGRNDSVAHSVTDLDNILNGESFDCDDYDDDTAYTSTVCGQFDAKMCFETKHNCADDFWCNTMCGKMCEEEGGAICLFDKFSAMEETCDSVLSILKDGLNVPDYAYDIDRPDVVDFEGHGIDTSLGDDGCSRHSYCTYCKGNAGTCSDGSVLTYIHETYGIVEIGTLKKAMIRILKTCVDLDYFSLSDLPTKS